MICLVPPPSFLVLKVNHLPLNHPLIIRLEMYIVHYNLLLHSLRYAIHFFYTAITIDIYDLRNHPHNVRWNLNLQVLHVLWTLTIQVHVACTCMCTCSMYVYVYAYMYMYIYVYMYIWILTSCTCTYMCTCTCVWILTLCTCTYTGTCTCMYRYWHCVRVHIHVCMDIDIVPH